MTQATTKTPKELFQLNDLGDPNTPLGKAWDYSSDNALDFCNGHGLDDESDDFYRVAWSTLEWYESTGVDMDGETKFFKLNQ